MLVKKYYPNFTDEELEIEQLSDLAEVTPSAFIAGALHVSRCTSIFSVLMQHRFSSSVSPLVSFFPDVFCLLSTLHSYVHFFPCHSLSFLKSKFCCLIIIG